MAIKNNLSTLLGQRRMKVQELVRQSGVSGFALYKLHRDQSRRIDYETLNKICKALNCSVGDILEYVPDEE